MMSWTQGLLLLEADKSGSIAISFQRRWLQEYAWLHYGKSGNDKGGWCLLCILFLAASENASLHLGVFVYTPFEILSICYED